MRRRGLLLQQQGGVRKRKREEGRSRKLHRPDNLPLSPPSSTGSHSLPLRRHDSHAASAPRGVRAEGQRDHTVMSSSPLPAASHSASRMKGIRYQANRLPTAPHIKRLVTDWFLISQRRPLPQQLVAMSLQQDTQRRAGTRTHKMCLIIHKPLTVASDFTLFRGTFSSSQQSVVFIQTKMKMTERKKKNTH